MSNLHKYAFSDLYDIASGLSSTKEQAGHGTPFASFSTVFNNIFLPDELPDLMQTSEKEQEVYSIKKGDILITRTSETVDELAMSCVALKDYPQATYSGFVKRLRPKTTGIAYEKFMAFFLRSKYFRKVIDCNTIMTLRASFNEDMFSFLDLYLPDYEEQVKVGDLLYNIERKIQNNKTINDNLQQQLCSQYQYCFMQNRSSTWNKTTLGDVSTLYQPQTISGSDLMLDGKYLVYGANGIIGKYDRYNHEEQQIAVACRGASCGALTMTLPKSWITGNAMVVSPNSSFPYKEFLFYTLSLISISYLTTGSAQPQLTRENMKLYSLSIPPLLQLLKFEEKAKIARSIITSNLLENKKLISLRDWLLPMLMNGQATIQD